MRTKHQAVRRLIRNLFLTSLVACSVLQFAGLAAAQDQPDNRPPRPPGQGGGQRPGGGPGGGGGGRIAENNKTPSSPNPGQTVGVFLNTPKAFAGFTLLAPKHNTNVYLINNDGVIVHQWHSQYYPGQSVYLKPNGNLLHTCMTRNRSFTGGGEGGRMVAPPAITSAVEDALKPFGVKIDEMPITPEKIVRWIKEAHGQ